MTRFALEIQTNSPFKTHSLYGGFAQPILSPVFRPRSVAASAEQVAGLNTVDRILVGLNSLTLLSEGFECHRLIATVDARTIIGVMRHPCTVLVLVWLLIMSAVCSATAQTTVKPEETPVVKSGEMPLYPPLARQARLQGTVRLKVTTDGAYITKVAASGAHKLLLDAAEENIRTWRFYKHRPQTFITTFVYKLDKEEVHGFVNPNRRS